ncbi:MAG TPA: DUF6328 family protein [Pyrinomonadaceae bacterium]|nr:DUF6328 family protein [Pyrinomonadaceae bacterium]
MELKDKIRLSLDESRMLVLGAQILLGFQFRVVFEPGFERLPPSSQYLKMIAMVILLGGIALIMSPGSYHRIVRAGNDAEDVQRFATTVMDFALVPFLLALAIELYVSTARILGASIGLMEGAFVGLAGLALWYGLGIAARSTRKARGIEKEKEEEKEDGKVHAQRTSLKDKIDQALTEARVVLPGAQALLGFQLVTIFMDGFDKLPNSSKYIHMISLTLMAVTMVFLMTPAAFHRIAAKGEESERVQAVASWFLIAAMTTLPLGIAGDVYILFLKVTRSVLASRAVAGGVLIFFYALWFGYTSYRRMKLHG